jgi:hypothetical protein
MWAEDNLRDYPYLLINPITGPDGNTQAAGPLAYTKSAAIPPAMAALLQITEQDMQDILGNPQGADKIVSGVSGKAVEMIQTRVDMQTFIYMSNFAKGMKRCGEIWLSMARDIYTEEKRKMKTIAPTGESSVVELMKPMIDTVNPVALALLVLGGLIYTSGVLIFISPKVKYRRAIWHGFVVAGAGVHWAAVLVGVVLAPNLA